MKRIITLIFIGLVCAAPAMAEDCSCLDEEELTDSCVDFSYTIEAVDCPQFIDPQELRLENVEEAVEKLQQKVKKLESKRKAKK